MKKRNSFIVITLIIGIAVSIGVIAFFIETNDIKGMKMNSINGSKSQLSGTDPKENSPSDGLKTIQADNSFGASKDTEGKITGYLFEIYSEKDNVEEAVKEISLKFIEQQKDFYNAGYIEDGVDQRIEDVRLVDAALDDRFGEESYDNLVEGGSLSVYYINFELKPKYPNKFIPMRGFETLQNNGWITMGGRELLIYHENYKLEAPYYLADFILFDGFNDGESPEQVIEEIVRDEIPQLKLLNTNN
jgi:hypothetical protein